MRPLKRFVAVALMSVLAEVTFATAAGWTIRSGGLRRASAGMCASAAFVCGVRRIRGLWRRTIRRSRVTHSIMRSTARISMSMRSPTSKTIKGTMKIVLPVEEANPGAAYLVLTLHDWDQAGEASKCTEP